MLNIILFGPPGAGKGTQSQYLKDKYRLAYFSTGDILREEMAAKTETGLKVKALIDAGNLVGDDIVVEMIRQKVKENIKGDGFLFDGFPRTVRQAEMLDEMFADFNLKINGVLSLEVPQDMLIERMLERGKTSGRADDNIDTIRHRFEEYDAKTKPVTNYYEKSGNLHKINGVGKIEEVFDRLCAEIDKM